MWPTPQAEQEFPTGPPGRKGVVGAGVRAMVLRQVREPGVCAEGSLYQECSWGSRSWAKGCVCMRAHEHSARLVSLGDGSK